MEFPRRCKQKQKTDFGGCWSRLIGCSMHLLAWVNSVSVGFILQFFESYIEMQPIHSDFWFWASSQFIIDRWSPIFKKIYDSIFLEFSVIMWGIKKTAVDNSQLDMNDIEDATIDYTYQLYIKESWLLTLSRAMVLRSVLHNEYGEVRVRRCVQISFILSHMKSL